MSVDVAIYGRDYFANLGVNQMVACEFGNKHINCTIQCFKETQRINKECDIYLLECNNDQDLENIKEYTASLKHSFVFALMSKDKQYFYDSIELGAAGFLLQPFNEAKVIALAHTLIGLLREEYFIVYEPYKKQTKVLFDDFMYAELVGRKIYYHLSDDSVIESRDVRASFQSETELIGENKITFYVTKTKLINISKIKSITSTSLIFNNDKELFYPDSARDNLMEKWYKYYNLELPESFLKKKKKLKPGEILASTALLNK